MDFTILLLCIVFVVFILGITIWLTSKKPQAKQESLHVFLPLSKIYDIIDNSIYFQRMSRADLSARNATSTQAYQKLYKDSIIEFTTSEKILLLELTSKLDKLTSQTKRFKDIPWKFAKVKTTIEEGYPHTLGDMIVLSDYFFGVMKKNHQIKTLFHEKCHVFQRLFPMETHKLIADYWLLTPIDTLNKNPLARNNPDINSFVYGTADGVKFFQMYNSNLPTSIRDSTVVAIDQDGNKTDFPLTLPSFIEQTEHPYEIMACLLPHLFIQAKSMNGNEFIGNVQDWATKYL